MKKKNNDLLINALNSVFNDSKNGKLTKVNFAKLSPNLRIIASYARITQEEALFFALILIENYTGSDIDVQDICRHLDVNSILFIKYYHRFEQLRKRGVLIIKPKRHCSSEIMTSKVFSIKHEIANAIIKGEHCPVIEKEKIQTSLDALGKIYQVIERRIDDELSAFDLHFEFTDLMNESKRFKLFKQFNLFDLSEVEMIVNVYVLWKSISGVEGVDIQRVVRSLHPNPSERLQFLHELKNNKNGLTKYGLFEINPTRFLNDVELKITAKMQNILEEDGINIEQEKSKKAGIIEPSSIGEKALYYNSSEASQIDSVSSMLFDKNYQLLMERLSSKNLPTSLNILLYGAPGTGKTESVLQLAKASGREIMKVDISQTKSMWFGESEKIIKKVFTDYAEYAKYAKKSLLTPILLFNEADAILGTRNSLNTGNTKQTENTIQNILLEELENFKGIFFVTTNLANNLDKAFERRFLFKVEFHKPSIESRTKIWMNKLSFITERDAGILAKQFDLSGGQIENIVRKSEIDFILHGEDVNLETLIKFCSEENLTNSNNRVQIGF